jgi:uncharacterized lipoprotein YajG
MKKSLKLTLVLIVAIVSITGCKKSATEITCNLATAATQPPVEMNIVYSASRTGDGSISSLSYRTITGMVTVQNPQLPWTITVPVLTTTDVSITATGTTTNGSIKITYEGNSGGSSIQGSDYCEHQSD